MRDDTRMTVCGTLAAAALAAALGLGLAGPARAAQPGLDGAEASTAQGVEATGPQGDDSLAPVGTDDAPTDPADEPDPDPEPADEPEPDPEPVDISGATVAVADQSWTGQALTPEVTVTLADGTVLSEGTDYTVAYADNVDRGTATVTVTGTGSYAGTAGATFEIGAPSFVDVTSSTAHADDVAWMAEQGLAEGWLERDGTRTFRPLASIARADMAAFLYRLAGSPDYAAPATSPFADVTPQTAHYKEICWLHSTGISTGWANADGSRSFRPNASIARADMAAFLYRLAGQPAVTDDGSGFSDVSMTTSHWREVVWLRQTGVSTGFPDGSFRPYASIARCDVAAFVHRMSSAGLVAPGTDASAGATAGWVRRSGSWHHLTNGTADTGQRQVTTAGLSAYYLFDSTGAMLTGLQTVDGKTYCYDAEGANLTGWQTVGGKRYLFQSDGSAHTGWYQQSGSLKRYYFDPADNGAMVTGTKTIDGTTQSFRSNGVWAPSSGVKHLDDICDWIIDNVTGYGSTNYDALRKLYDWARRRTYIHGNEYPAGGWRTWSIPYAQQMWDNGGGNCYRYASIVCWTARRLGYDANTVSGWVPTYSGRAAHGWCEVHINGQTYIIDASLGRHVTSRNFFMVQYGNAPTTYHVISR